MNVLVIAPHPDDEILGVGGSIIKHINKGDNVYVCIVSEPNVPIYSLEHKSNIREEIKNVHEFIGVKETILLDFTATELNRIEAHFLNNEIEKIINCFLPEVLYIPFYKDIHIDHRIVAKASLVAARPISQNFIRTILSYETLSSTEWSIDGVFNPNFYNDISNYIDKKKKALSLYKNQLRNDPHPRSIENSIIQARLRGSNINIEYAEAFQVIRIINSGEEKDV